MGQRISRVFPVNGEVYDHHHRTPLKPGTDTAEQHLHLCDEPPVNAGQEHWRGEKEEVEVQGEGERKEEVQSEEEEQEEKKQEEETEVQLIEPAPPASSTDGTMEYYPPEYRTMGKYHAKSAMSWSVGVILFMMLCGRFPTGEDLQKTKLNLWSEPGVSEGPRSFYNGCMAVLNSTTNVGNEFQYSWLQQYKRSQKVPAMNIPKVPATAAQSLNS
ncbi:hypothetical protein Q8A67_003545 [Cirrhinus molitorella]|uniref:non-specific serine/threonine protein kinase n=1 Tax=Cirrhinus molitorella TaxID=172907 RepID=A0AA88QEQ8_9TELE|nr:hypothetical protein Q8A67_003545 [Cirrhinus molitorella]